MRGLKLSILFILAVFGGMLLVPSPDATKKAASELASVSVGTDVASTTEKSVFQNTVIPPEASVASVLRVVDGDTVSIRIHDTEETVRLIGIDAPESVDPRRPVECFGVEASLRLKELLPEKIDVYVASDSTQDTRDKYGRLLAYLYLPSGDLVNMRMITEGYAHEYTYQTPYIHQEAFRRAEGAAKATYAGLWSKTACNAKTSPAPAVSTSTGSTYQCTENVYNCGDFKTRAEAQKVLDACDPSRDVHKLDQDGDGIACETLP